MTGIDFLPPAYRQRLARRRVARERAWLAVPIVLGLVATDLVLRWRVQNVRRMADLAEQHAVTGQQRGDVARDLGQRITGLQAAIGELTAPLEGARMTAWLDELLAARPDAVTFHELSCRQHPWAAGDLPSITLQATSSSPAEFTLWLAALQANDRLPALQCRRTFQAGGSGELGFELHNDPGAAPR